MPPLRIKEARLASLSAAFRPVDDFFRPSLRRINAGWGGEGRAQGDRGASVQLA